MLSPDHWARVTELFGELADLSPAERASRLASLGADEVELRNELEELLRAADSVGDRFDESPARAAAEATQPSMTGQRVGAYQIVREVGRGGMGSLRVAGGRAVPSGRQQMVPAMPASVKPSRVRRERNAAAEHRNLPDSGGGYRQGQPYS